MSEFLFESPVTIGVTGAALTVIAAITWIKGGFAAALYAALALFLLTILLVVMNLQIQTDREKIEGVMSQVASAVQNNDLQQVLEHVHPARSAALTRAKAELPNYQFSEARITGIKKIEVNSDTNPPSAIAEFNVSVSLVAQGNPIDHFPRFVRCYFLREGDRWLVNDYEHHEATYGFKLESEK